MLTLQTAIVLSTGQLWLYLLQFPVANLVMCVLFARTARGPSPLVARLAAEVVALRQPGHHPGLHRFFQGATWLWAGIFFLLTAGLGVLMVTEPTKLFIMLSTVLTVGAGGGRAWACRLCGSGPSCAGSASACASRPPDRPALPAPGLGPVRG